MPVENTFFFHNKLKMYLFISLFFFTLKATASTDVIGCFGFVKSSLPLDFSQVDIRLYTKQETLKDSSECAPTNGYYFIPLSDKGEYTLRVEPPAGWYFEPNQVPILFDGVNDPCSRSMDINFNFKGFGVNGKVTTRGSLEGPEGVKVVVKSASGLEVTTTTRRGGSFQLGPVTPGNHTVTAFHNSLKFAASSASVVFGVDNLEVPPGALLVAGYDVTGTIVSNGEPVKGVHVFIFPAQGKGSGLPYDCKTTAIAGVGAGALCHVTSDSTGSFRFVAVPAGQYLLRPHYETFQVQPSELQIVVDQAPITLAERFMVKGFSVKGRVVAASRQKGLAGVTVYLDKSPVTTTDADGRFQLDRMETGTYDLTAKTDDFLFSNHRVKISPAWPELEPLVVAAVRVCGRVVTSAGAPTPRLQIRPADPSLPVLVIPVVDTTGKFCEFLAPGGYSVSVMLNDAESNLSYLPVSKEIKVSDTIITDIEFSQLRAVVQGRISKLVGGQRSRNIVVKLKTRDNLVNSVVVDDSYSFPDVAPGTYTVQIESQTLCFAKDSQQVFVNSPQVKVPDFVQSGYVIRIRSSHQTAVDIKTLKRDQVKSAELVRGENSVCLPTSDQYLFAPSGCHGYDLSEMTWEVGRDSMMDLVAVSHDVTGIVTTNEQAFVHVTVQSGGQTVATLGPLKATASGDIYRHEFKFRVKEGQLVQFTPRAVSTVFIPETAELRGGNDCILNGVFFSGERGLLIEGRINPPLEGVLVTLKMIAPPSEVTQSTKADGKFVFGPLKRNAQFQLTAALESYVLTGPDASYTFQADKLAQVHVIVTDNASQAPLSGVLLSLTGGEKYRKNSITEESGERTFHSLSPGEYFLRPMMKEYKFDPASVIVKLNAGETKNMALRGRRVSFSVFGVITSLNGEPEEGVPVEVVGKDKCAGMQEEGVSDTSGAFRVRGLVPDCEYTLQMKQDTKSTVYRIAPANKTVSTKKGDVRDIRLIAFHEVEQSDVTVHVTSAVAEHLKTLTVKLYKEDQLDSPIHAVRLDTLGGGVKNWGNAASQERFIRGGLWVSLPFVAKDGAGYVVTADSSLSHAGHTYAVPSVQFNASRPFLALALEFNAKLKAIEQESPRHFVAGLLFALVGILYWQFRQGWPAASFILAWWAARQESLADGAGKKKMRARRT